MFILSAFCGVWRVSAARGIELLSIFFVPLVYSSAVFHSSQLAHGGVSVPNCLKHSSFLSHLSPGVRSHLLQFPVVLCGYTNTWLKQI